MKKLYYINYFIITLILVSSNLFSQDLQELPPSYDKLTDSIKNVVKDLDVNNKLKKLQEICWDLRFSNSIDALKAGRASVDLAKKLNNYEDLAQGYSFIGVIYLHITDYTNANDYFLKALKVSEKHNLLLEKAYSYNNLSHLFKYMNKIQDAYNNIWKSKEIMEQIDDKRGLAYAYLRLSDLYITTKNWDSAYHYAIKTVDIRKGLGNKKAVARAMLNVGESLEGLNKYQKALDIYLSITKDIEEIGKIEIYIARAYYNLENYQQAIQYAQQAFDKTAKLSLYQQLYDASIILFDSYKKLNDYSNALKYSDLKFNYRDSLFVFERDRQVAILNYTFDLDKKEKENQELVRRGKDKDKFIMMTSVAIVLLFIGSVSLFFSRKKIKKFNDLLKEKNIEIQKQSDELHELNATKDKFFSIIAHDLKNPIGSFKNVTDFFKDHFDELDIEEQLEFIQTLSESSNQVYNLLENLLEWSRIQRGSITYNPIEFDLHYVVDNCKQLLSYAATQKKIFIQNDIAQETNVDADINMITTVVRNLISNAIKFTKENGNIIVNINNYDKNKFVVSVEDNGIGMSQDTINKLFKIDSNHTTLGTANEKGTGLGLILCKEFVEKNNGTMWVESEINKGSKFKFTLPKAKK